MASYIIRRDEKGNRSVEVVSGGEVVASREYSKDEYKSVRGSGSSRDANVSLINDTIAMQNASLTSGSPVIGVQDSQRQVSRVLTPFEQAVVESQGDFVSTEQGVQLISPVNVNRVSSPSPSPVQQVSAFPDEQVSSRERRSVGSVLGSAARESFGDFVFASASPFPDFVDTSLLAPFGRSLNRAVDSPLASRRGISEVAVLARDAEFNLFSPGSATRSSNPFSQLVGRSEVGAGVAASFLVLPSLGAAEASLLSRVSPGVARFGAGVALTTAEAGAIGGATRLVDIAAAPKELRPFVRQNDVFRAAQSAEISSEPSFVRRQLAGLNSGFSRQGDVFSETARQELINRGYSSEEVSLGVEALEFRRSRSPFNEALVTLNSGRFSEIYGRVNTASINPQGRSFFQNFRSYALAIAPAGYIEVRGELGGRRAAVGSDLPFIDTSAPLRSLLPSVSLRNGFRIEQRSQLGEELFFGSLGATSAAILGGFVGAGYSAPKGSRARVIGQGANIVGNIADPSEPFTDLLAFRAGYSPRVNTLVPSFVDSNVPSSVSVSSVTSPVSVPVNTRVNVPSVEVVSDVVSPSDFIPSFSDIFSPVTSPVDSRTPIPSFVPVDSVAEVPSLVPSIVPSEVISTVPTIVPNAILPPPFGMDLSFGGGSGNYGSNRRTVFVNELSAAGDALRAFEYGGASSKSVSRSGKKKRVVLNNPFKELDRLGRGFF